MVDVSKMEQKLKKMKCVLRRINVSIILPMPLYAIYETTNGSVRKLIKETLVLLRTCQLLVRICACRGQGRTGMFHKCNYILVTIPPLSSLLSLKYFFRQNQIRSFKVNSLKVTLYKREIKIDNVINQLHTLLPQYHITQYLVSTVHNYDYMIILYVPVLD